MTPKEKIEYYEANDLAGYQRDKMIEHDTGFGFTYQPTEGVGPAKTLVIACTEDNITVE